MQMAAASDERGRGRARTGPAVTTVRQRCWASSFPDDLLDVVYRMLASPRGRVRFAAVCRSWRAAARTALPAAALPWLLLSPYKLSATKHLYCPEDGAVVPISLPSSMRLIGCHDGGWVISAITDPVRIVNLFSGAELPLSEKQRRVVSPDRPFRVSKTVCSELPTSDDCILAAKTTAGGIALCRVGCPDSGWTVQLEFPEEDGDMDEIAVCRGGVDDMAFELYVLKSGANGGALVKLEIGVNDHGAPVVTAEHQLAVEHPVPTATGHLYFPFPNYGSYMFDLHGKLAMAISTRWSPSVVQPFFKVFELVDIPGDDDQPNTRYRHKWLEVTSLGDHALFLGDTSCKVVHVPEKTRGHVERNCIYYSSSSSDQITGVPSDSLFFTSGDQTYHLKYNINIAGDDGVKRIKSVGYFVKNFEYGAMWIHPPNIQLV